MRPGMMVAILGVLVLVWPGHTPAQAPRIAVFAVHCFVPRTHGLHTRAVLQGTVAFPQRTVRFTATCLDGPSAARFPEFQESDGPVKSIDLSVLTTLEDRQQRIVAQNHCLAQSRNGFLTFRCAASEADGGEVDLLVSIAPLPRQRPTPDAPP